jgi:hypothetical protein
MENTFAKAIFEGAVKAADSEAGKQQLTGLSRDQFVESVRVFTEAIDKLPPATSLHILLYAVTYLRNAVITTIQLNQKRMEEGPVGGSA